MTRFYFQVTDSRDRMVNSGYFKAKDMESASDVLLSNVRSAGAEQGHLFEVKKPGMEPEHVAVVAIVRPNRG